MAASTTGRTRWVCLDVGETLIDETRVWSLWADELGVPRLTFLAALGAVIERNGEHRDVFPMFGADDWPTRLASVEASYGGFRPDDLYPDALDALAALKGAGYRLAVVANQPAIRGEQLRAIGVDTQVMAMSEGLGVAKPDPAFSTTSLPAASSNAGIIAVLVGPGFRQLSRTPRSPNFAHVAATHWFITTFDMR